VEKAVTTTTDCERFMGRELWIRPVLLLPWGSPQKSETYRCEYRMFKRRDTTRRNASSRSCHLAQPKLFYLYCGNKEIWNGIITWHWADWDPHLIHLTMEKELGKLGCTSHLGLHPCSLRSYAYGYVVCLFHNQMKLRLVRIRLR
jgi:hypothetical protein